MFESIQEELIMLLEFIMLLVSNNSCNIEIEREIPYKIAFCATFRSYS